MRRLFFFLGLLLSVVFLVGAYAPNTTPSSTSTSPSWAEFALDRYPLIPKNRPMTDAEAVKLEFTRGKLERDTWVFNHYRALCPKGQVCGKWEVLKAGTEVAWDKDKRPWYKWDCANRLYMPVRHGPAWWPFGGSGPRWPWWLPWLLLLPLLGLLGWLFGRRREEQEKERREPEPPRPGNGNGGGTDLPGPAEFRPPPAPPAPAVDPAAARRAALKREVAVATAKAEAHEAEAARLSTEGRAATDDAEAEQKLRAAHDERQAAVAARATAAAKQAELVALGAAAATTPQPAPVPAPPTDEKAGLLAALRAAGEKAGIKYRALRVAVDALEANTMTPDEVRGWLQKLGITLS